MRKTHTKPVGATIGRPFLLCAQRATDGRPYKYAKKLLCGSVSTQKKPPGGRLFVYLLLQRLHDVLGIRCDDKLLVGGDHEDPDL